MCLNVVQVSIAHLTTNVSAAHERWISYEGIEPSTLGEDFREFQRPVKRHLATQVLLSRLLELLKRPVLDVVADADGRVVPQGLPFALPSLLQFSGGEDVRRVTQAGQLLLGLL